MLQLSSNITSNENGSVSYIKTNTGLSISTVAQYTPGAMPPVPDCMLEFPWLF